MKARYLLKLMLIILPTLIFLNYSEGASDIIFAINTSLKKQRRVLIKFMKRKRYLSRYKTGIWSSVERKYDIIKWECQGVFKALNKVRYLLYRVRIILKTEVSILVAKLN